MQIKKINARFFLIITGIMMLLVSCSDKNGFIEMISQDKTKPEPIKEYRVSNFNGGAHIVYKLPKADNILYVKANYYLGDGTDRPIETRSSYFSDTTTVEGFADAKEYEVKLTVVSRSNVESEPVIVKVTPLTPVYQLVAHNLQMTPDFAGVRVMANNEQKKNVGIVFLDNVLGQYSIRQQTFSDFPQISFPIRGYDTIPKVFAAYIVDKWGNRSDTIFNNVKPLFEKQLNKALFRSYILADNETPIYGGNSYPLTNLFDGDLNSFWHTVDAAGTTMPLWGTFSLGTYVKLSRFKFTRRNFAPYYGHNHPKYYSLWGSDVDRPGPFVPPLYADEGTRIGDWFNIGNFESPEPPSGAPRTAPTEADNAAARSGEEHDVPFSAPKVRHIRLVVSETFGKSSIAQGANIDFWGDDR